MKRLLNRAASALGATALMTAGLVATAGPSTAAAPQFALTNKPSCTQTQPKVRVTLDFADKGPTSIGFDSTRDPDTWAYALRDRKNGSHTLTLPRVPAGYEETFRVKLEHNPGTAKRRTYYSKTYTFKVPESCSKLQLFDPIPEVSTKGTLQVGRRLTVNTGVWGPKQPTTFTYQWQRGHAGNIKGATNATYTLKAADHGKRIRVIVTAKRWGYADMRRTSAWSATTRAATFTSVPTPGISGTPSAGKTLTAWPGAWSPKPSKFSYQWYRSGNKVPGATSRFYKVTSRDKGRTLRVKVTAVRGGFISKSALSRIVTAR